MVTPAKSSTRSAATAVVRTPAKDVAPVPAKTPRKAAAGKAPGILSTDEAQAQRWLDAGARFVAVGLDTVLLANAARQLRQRFAGAAPGPTVTGY